ncbi:MAG: TolC family protein [Pseudomonadota bacterium]
MLRISYLTVILLLLWSCFASAADLTLKECFKRAAQMNPALMVAAHNKNLAKEDVSIARSGYLPRLDMQGGYTFQDDPQAFKALGGSFEIQEKDYSSLNLVLNQTIYDFGKTSSIYNKSKAMEKAAGFDYKGKEQDVFLQVVKAYYGILEAKKILKSADEEVLQITQHLQISKDFYEQGISTLNDFLQAEVKLAASIQQQLAAANRLENRWLYLNYLINQVPSYRPELEDRLEHIEDLPAQGIEKAVDTRQEIKAMKEIVAASKYEVQDSRSNYAPQVFMRLGFDYTENDKAREQSIAMAMIGLKMNIFDGWATTSGYRRAVEQKVQNQKKLRLLTEQIKLEYRTAANDAMIAKERIKATEKAIEQGEENLRITKNRYQELVGTATEVIDAQTLLTQVRTDNYRAKFDYQVAIARVKRAMGEL